MIDGTRHIPAFLHCIEQAYLWWLTASNIDKYIIFPTKHDYYSMASNFLNSNTPY